MKSAKWIVFGLALAMMAGTVMVLFQLKTRQHLTRPGVKVGSARLYDEDTNLVAETAVLLPANLPGCASFPRPIAKNELATLPKDTTFGRRAYAFTNGFAALIQTVLMGSDRTSIHQPQFCLTGQGWTIEKQENISLRIDRPYPYLLPALKLTASNMIKDENGHPLLVRGIYVYWFVSADKLTAGQGTRMWSMLNTLLHQGLVERWAYISYFAVCLPGREQTTDDHLEDFIRLSLPEFQLTTGAKIQ